MTKGTVEKIVRLYFLKKKTRVRSDPTLIRYEFTGLKVVLLYALIRERCSYDNHQKIAWLSNTACYNICFREDREFSRYQLKS